MRRVKKVKKSSLSFNKELLKDKVYATIDGVLQPIVYDKRFIDSTTAKENVFLTPEKRLARRKNAKNKASLTVPQIQDNSVINPIFTFEYNKGFVEVTSGNNIKTWLASFSKNQLSQSDEAHRPDIGLDGRGVNGFSPAYFSANNKDYMTFNNSITLSGDFTVFLYVEPIPEVANVHTNHRFLGKSDDADMYFSIGEYPYRSYSLSFSSSSIVLVSITGLYWRPTEKKLLITLQRSGSTLYIRENGVQVASETTPTTDFTFNQFGRIGGVTSPTYNGSLYHISAFDGYITTELEKLEQSIIKQASLAKG